MPNVWGFLYLKLLFDEKISTYIPWLTKVFASVKLINPFPKIQTFIIILILTTKIR